MKLLIFAFLLVSLRLFAETISSSSETSQLSYHADNTCAHSAATWESTKLYDFLYTFGCIPDGWESFFAQDEVKLQVQDISEAIGQQIQHTHDRIMPLLTSTFRAMNMVPPDRIKAVILGQDPAPEYGLATGLSFSIPANFSTSLVPSIQRVLLEARNEGFRVNITNGDLSRWADQGVLLLNSALTIPCPQGQYYCHIGEDEAIWSDFTVSLFRYINANAPPSAIILWGSKAGKFKQYINNPKLKVIEGGHPSPRANGQYFFCGNYFFCANEWLQLNTISPVKWSLSQNGKNYPSCVWSWNSTSKESGCEHYCKEKECGF